MKMNVYAIYDVKAAMFQRPIFATRDGEATRAFIDVLANPEHPITRHPEDYSLFRIGTYDDLEGIIEDEPNVQIITALSAKAMNEDINSPEVPGGAND
jgi:hypothetical protein